jgi:hypothetical protein
VQRVALPAGGNPSILSGAAVLGDPTFFDPAVRDFPAVAQNMPVVIVLVLIFFLCHCLPLYI